MDDKDITTQIKALKDAHDRRSSDQGKDELYNQLLDKYASSLEKILDLEREISELKSKSAMPTKDDVDAMSGMLDLINKLDDATIAKLNQFGAKK